MDNDKRYRINSLNTFGTALLEDYGTPKKAAQDVLHVLLAAEARGFGSHGLLRLPRVVTGIKSKTHLPNVEPDIEKKGAICFSVDANFALGPHVARRVMSMVVEQAKTNGICVATVKNATHFGIGGYYAEMASEAGLVGLVLCNTQPATAPFGGTTKALGTNPISFSVPLKGANPITLDMATTAAARGRILFHQLKNEPLAEWIAAGPDGVMTTDPEEALKGFLLPLGGMFGYKGTGLAMMVDVLSGGLSGAATGTRVNGTLDTTVPCTAGFIFLAINPDFFCGREQFESEITALVADMRAAGPDVLLPGEREHALEAKAREHGICLPENLTTTLAQLGVERGIEFERNGS